ncbi:DNA mismatch repair endonuclease MutL [Thermodesulfovibrio hydrogeniphilus]
MKKIKILPEALIGKIAAGEVVERPASVIKELIENSIDADSHSISVYVKEYGIAEIKVIDDGEGISSEDVELSFQRHATSKIEKESDLFRIQTLGFRGEALYSIAQISKTRITTQHRDEPLGTELYLIAGEIVEKKPAVTKGTSIQINDLFFNTPVRKKFLKAPATEKAHIIETVQNYAIAFPQIALYLNIDGQEILNIPKAASLQERISQILGHDFIENSEFRSISKAGYKIELFWGKEQLQRRSRMRQLIFVNKRPVKDSIVTSSLYKAFQVRDMHPQFAIFIYLPPEKVDFNVHPAKKEIRFREPNLISELIFKISALSEKTEPSFVAESERIWDKSTNSSNFEQSPLFKGEFFLTKEEPVQFLNLGDAIIAIKQEDGILFLDYHAAHERINFEKLLKGMSDNIYRLVFPEIINLNPKDYAIIKDNLSILRELGIEAEDFGNNSVIVRGIPQFLKNADIVSIIESIASEIKEEIIKPNFADIKGKIAATIACHSSLRANNPINSFEIKKLLIELGNTQDPDHCPHGRPLKRFVPFREIKRWFMR